MKINIFKFEMEVNFKDGLLLKLDKIHIHLYLIATQYLWNYALVEDLDNWTRSHSPCWT